MIGRSGYAAQPPNGSFPAIQRRFSGPVLQRPFLDTDTRTVRVYTSTLDRITASFADAVCQGDFDTAEGWLVVARYAAWREGERTRARLAVRGTPARLRRALLGGAPAAPRADRLPS